MVLDASKEAPGKEKSPYMHSFLHLRLRKKGKTGIEDKIISSTQQIKCCNVGSCLSDSKKLHVLVLPMLCTYLSL